MMFLWKMTHVFQDFLEWLVKCSPKAELWGDSCRATEIGFVSQKKAKG